DADKNALTGVVPLPDGLDDFIRMQAANMMNQAIWGQNKPLRNWMRANRLDGFSELMAQADMNDPEVVEIMTRLRKNALPAAMKLQSLLSA
ncbi:MAG: NAD(P)/FAD-dependent oxidoreductase, partial [Pseudomonadota bacterium]